jgi:hypothetical protein
VKSIRILLIGMPKMLQDLVKGILSAQPTIRTVEEVDEPQLLDRMDSSPQASRSDETEVFILSLHNEDLPEIGRRILTTYPEAGLLGISSDGRKAVLYELRPHAIPLGELSPASLVDAVVRRATGSRGRSDPWSR